MHARLRSHRSFRQVYPRSLAVLAPMAWFLVCRGVQRRLRKAIMVKFKPLHDRVLLRRVEAEEKTPGGVIIPPTAKEKPVEGEVLAVGPGMPDELGKLRALGVKVGDRVLMAKWAGTEVLIGGEDRLIVKESQILGTIELSRRATAKAA